MIKHILFLLITTVIVGLTSCSNDDYTNSIPSNSTALIAVNAADFVGDKSPFASLLMPFVDNDEKRLKGIDLTKDIFLFTSGDGNLGMCAPLSDDDEFDDFLGRLATLGVIKNHTENDGKDFYTFNDQWVIGYNDYTLLVMGPVTGADAEAKLTRRMTKLMEKDEDQSIKRSMIWQHLEEQKSHIRMVAQVSALPEQVASTVTLGAPQGTDPADILLEAELSYDDGTLLLTGTTCSYNPNIKQCLKKSQSQYRPITVDWQKVMGDTTLVGVFMNVEGKDFMPQLQKDKALNTMLIGTGAYDRIRDNNGDMAILLMPSKGKGDDDIFVAKVLNLPAGNVHGNDRLVVAINVDALTGPLSQTMTPFMGKVKRIIYNMKVE